MLTYFEFFSVSLVFKQYKYILFIKICTLLPYDHLSQNLMESKYQITSKAQPLSLNFTIKRIILSSKSYEGKDLHASINLLNLHPDILKLFGTFESFCQYVSSHPENVYYDQLQFSLVIKFEVIDLKYIYLPIVEIEEQKIRKNVETLLMLEEAVKILKQQVFLQHIDQRIQQKLKQIECYSQNMKKAKSQCEKFQGQIKKIDQKLAKLYKKSLELQDQIQKQLKTQQQKQKIDNLKEEKNKKRRQLFLEAFNKCEDMRVKKLKQKPNQEVNVIDLRGCDLKSMIMVYLYKNLKEIRLPSNLIQIIEGLQNLSELTHLDLNTNEIQVIQGLGKNKNLRQLILHTNSISKFSNVFHLKKLEILSLSFNKLIQVPRRIMQLQSLVELRLENNQINILAEDLLEMKELKVITLLGNPCFTHNHRMQPLIDSLVQKKNIITITPDY